MQPRPWPLVPEQTALVARAAFPKGSLAMAVRDELGEVFSDGEFTAAFGDRGAPAESPGRLALVTALQFVEGLTGRQAAQAVRGRIDWKYALGLELTDAGFDYTVLSKFRARVAAHDLQERALDLLMEAMKSRGLVKAGGKQRTDSTHVISAIRDLNRLELAGESVRACVEALAVAAPDWLAQVVDVPGWSRRYGARVDSWRLPASKTKRKELAAAYGADALALLRAVYHPAAPQWLPELPAVEALRVVLLQNYTVTTGGDGTEVVKRREADTDGLPPAGVRLTSPYDVDARWSAKGDDLFWNGYKVHLTETCGDAPGSADGAGGALRRVERGRQLHQPGEVARAARRRQRPHVLQPEVAGELVDPPGPGGVLGVREPHSWTSACVLGRCDERVKAHVDAVQHSTAITTRTNGTGKRRRLRGRRRASQPAVAVAASQNAADQRSSRVFGSASGAQASAMKRMPKATSTTLTTCHVKRTMPSVIEGGPNGVLGRRPFAMWESVLSVRAAGGTAT